MVGFELNIVTDDPSLTTKFLPNTTVEKRSAKGGWRAQRRAVLRQRQVNVGHRYFDVDPYVEEFSRGEENSFTKGNKRKSVKIGEGDHSIGGKREEKQGNGQDREVKKRRRVGLRREEYRRSTGDVGKQNEIDEETWAATMDVVEREGDQDTDRAMNMAGEFQQERGALIGEGKGFAGLGLDEVVVKHLADTMGVHEPTKVQEAVIKYVVMRRAEDDLLVRSPTGTGKTLAYVLPILHFLLNRQDRISRDEGTYALIVTPTRELAEQVEDVATQVCRPWYWIVVGSVRGGENKHKEKARLRKGISVLVATPGRLVDHMRNTKSFNYSRCEFLVLDEADRLLDLGFEADVKEAIQSLNCTFASKGSRRRRCNLLLSATLDRSVKRLAQYSLEDPEKIVCDADERSEKFAMPRRLSHYYSIVEQKRRLVSLAAFIRLRATRGARLSAGSSASPGCKIMVFFSSCDSVEFHYRLFQVTKLSRALIRNVTKTVGVDTLEKNEVASERMIPLDLFMIHGNRQQNDRRDALHGFRRSKGAVLFCTDVAARGLDLRGVGLTIQYDPPTGGTNEDLEYLHRAGRTARVGKHGDTVLFLLPSEKVYKRKLEDAGVKTSEISGEAALAALQPSFDVANISCAARLSTSLLQSTFESYVTADERLKDMAMLGYQSYCRAYATHSKDSKHIFHVRNLHLGHVARAFGLREKPKDFSLDQVMRKAIMESGRHRTRSLSKEGSNNDLRNKATTSGEPKSHDNSRAGLTRRQREGEKSTLAFQELTSEFVA